MKSIGLHRTPLDVAWRKKPKLEVVVCPPRQPPPPPATDGSVNALAPWRSPEAGCWPSSSTALWWPWPPTGPRRPRGSDAPRRKRRERRAESGDGFSGGSVVQGARFRGMNSGSPTFGSLGFDWWFEWRGLGRYDQVPQQLVPFLTVPSFSFLVGRVPLSGSGFDWWFGLVEG